MFLGVEGTVMTGKTTRPSVLVTATDSASALACVRSLGSHGVDTVAASEIETAAAFSSRYCDEAAVVPSPREHLLEYRDALLSIARRPAVRTILPTREEDAYVLSRYRTAFEPHVAALWPPFETLRCVHDRLRLAETAADVGVPVPETRALEDVENWDRDQIAKPRYSLLADAYVDSIPPDRCHRSKTVTHLPRGVGPGRDALATDGGNSEMIVQQFVPSVQEYSFAALYEDGEAVTTYQKRHIRGKNYAGGPSAYRESTYVPELEAYGRALLDHLDWHGIAEVQFLRDATTGEFTLLEVNPMVWGSLPCAVRVGADFPLAYFLLAVGERERISQEYERGGATHFLYGELEYLASVLRDDYPLIERPRFSAAAWDVVSSLAAHPHFDHLDLDDPRPFVRGALNAIAGR